MDKQNQSAGEKYQATLNRSTLPARSGNCRCCHRDGRNFAHPAQLRHLAEHPEMPEPADAQLQLPPWLSGVAGDSDTDSQTNRQHGSQAARRPAGGRSGGPGGQAHGRAGVADQTAGLKLAVLQLMTVNG